MLIPDETQKYSFEIKQISFYISSGTFGGTFLRVEFFRETFGDWP